MTDRSSGKGRRAWRALWRWFKRAVLLALLVAVGGLIVVTSLPKPLQVDMVTVRRGSMRVTVDEDGRARVRDRDRYIVSAPLRCHLSRIRLEPGDDVAQGDIIAYLSPLDAPILDDRERRTAESRVAAATAAREQTSAQIEGAEAALTYATAAVDRMNKLLGRSTVSQQALDQAVLDHRRATADLDSLRFAALVADHELNMAKAALARGEGDEEQLEVAAPVAGRVLHVMRKSEAVVEAGAPLVEIGALRALEIVVDVLTSDAVGIELGARATIERWGGAPLAARVRSIEPSAFTRLSALGVEEQRVNVILDLDSPREEWTSLGDGYRIEARITVWEAEDVLTVPASAVFRDGKDWAVYRVVAGMVVLTRIEVAHRNAVEVEVTAGLEVPAHLVLQPSDRVQDGVEVTARAAGR